MTDIIKTAIAATVAVAMVVLVLVPVCEPTADNAALSSDLQVYVLAGQSNAAYHFEDLSVVNDTYGEPDSELYYFGSDTRPLLYNDVQSDLSKIADYSLHPMYSDSWVIGNVDMPFAYTLSELSRQNVLVINTGVAGRSVLSFDPTNDTQEYKYAKGVLETALSQISEPYECRGVIWIQGEADKTLSIDTYKASWKRVMEWYEGYGFDSQYLVNTSQQTGGNARAAQQQLASEIPTAHMCIDTNDFFQKGLMRADNLHYTQEGDDVIGEAVAHTAYNVISEHAPAHSRLLMIVPVIAVVGIILAVVRTAVSRYDL